MVDVDAWVGSADDPNEHTVRRVMRFILLAVARSPKLSGMMVMKGGVLLALGYATHRHTKDVDFSASTPIQQESTAAIREALQQALETVRADHDELFCRVQSHEVRPARGDATHPTLRLKIGYAVAGSPMYTRMVQGRPSTSTVKVDLSFNEHTYFPTTIVIDGHELVAYSLFDQIAEKYRAMIQQTSDRRDRVRRQDVYDIFKVLDQGYLNSMEDRLTLLETMRRKFHDRGVECTPSTIAEPEIEHRCRSQYRSLEDELDEPLPDFEVAFETVKTYYQSLPWGRLGH